jgi:RimJ/RimL family protein N-acetyltransferase
VKLGARWGPLSLIEPTDEEVRTYAARLAADYNEPVNRALMTNETEMSEADVVEMFGEMRAEGGRPFLLFDDEALVGDCDFREVDSAGGSAEFAIMIGPRGSQGRGLGTRFGIIAHAVAFGPLGLRRVYAAIRPENAGSLRMFEKLGYARDDGAEARRYAEASDDVCMSIDEALLCARHAEALAQIALAPRG